MMNCLGSSRSKWKLSSKNAHLSFFIDSKLSCHFKNWCPVFTNVGFVQMHIFSPLLSAYVTIWEWYPNNTWSIWVFNSVVYVLYNITCTISEPISHINKWLVVRSYFAAVATDTTEYKPIVFVGSSRILFFICFLRSSDISPTIMSTALTSPLSFLEKVYRTLLWACTGAFVVNKCVMLKG